ncbi:hypothetical protein pb186bvf_009830 [Paramecium bursaria]
MHQPTILKINTQYSPGYRLIINISGIVQWLGYQVFTLGTRVQSPLVDIVQRLGCQTFNLRTRVQIPISTFLFLNYSWNLYNYIQKML